MNPQLIYNIAEQVHAFTQKGREVMRLHVGEPEGQPPEMLGRAVSAAIAEGKTKYGSAYGEPALRERLARMHGVKKKNILIGPGSKYLLFSLFHHFLQSPEDEIILPLPNWSAFPLMLKSLGKGALKPVPTSLERNWQIPEDVASQVTARAKLMMLVDPNNPTSVIQSDECVKRLRQIAREKNIILIVDEAYHSLQYHAAEETPIDLAHEVRVHTFSKPFSMTGFRIGYLIAREEVVDALAKFFQITVTCVPPFIQHAALALLDHEQAFTVNLREKYKKRFALADEILKPAGIAYAMPDAAFYIFAKLPIADTAPFAAELLEDRGVAVVPGSAFGSYSEFVRISLTETDERLTQGLKTLVGALHAYA